MNIATDTVEGYIPTFKLSIYGASALFGAPARDQVYYSFEMPAGRGSNKAKGAIAFTQSIVVLTDKIKALVAAPAPTQNP